MMDIALAEVLRGETARSLPEAVGFFVRQMSAPYLLTGAFLAMVAVFIAKRGLLRRRDDANASARL